MKKSLTKKEKETIISSLFEQYGNKVMRMFFKIKGLLKMKKPL